MKTISIQEIKDHKKEGERIRRILDNIGKIFAQIRNDPIDSRFNFSTYYLTLYDGYYEEDYPLGTPVVELNYFCGRSNDVKIISIPQTWIDIGDWKEQEERRIKEDAIKKRNDEILKRHEQEKQFIENERKEYERLRQKFEGLS